MLTDLSFPVTAKRIGPNASVETRPGFSPAPRVFYLKSADLKGMEPDIRRAALTIFVGGGRNKKRVDLFETPDEFLAMQALSQGATAAQVFTKNYAAFTPTSSATASDLAVPTKYYNEISAVGTVARVTLPDPFVKRLFVLQNLTGTGVSVTARGTTSAINGTTAAYTIGAGERAHFVAPTAATAGTTAGWVVARDVGA